MLYWFIVEGCDNIGKTTMINQLMVQLTDNGYDVVAQHFGAPKGRTKADKIAYAENEAKDTVNNIRKLANASFNKDTVLIHDRSIFGELTYGRYRGYNAEHLPETVRKLQHINYLNTTFILLYGETAVAKRMGIKFKDDCKKDYAHENLMAQVSADFINKVHALEYPEARKLVFNLSNYASLDERNYYVYQHIRSIIRDESYTFRKTNSHVDTPFNINNKVLTDVGFIANPAFVCKRYTTCALGKEHKRNCKENGGVNSPIYGYGGMHPKVVLIGEVSHHNVNFAGHLPFYNSVSGNVVQQALYDLKISPFDVYITNVIKCTPLNNDLGVYSNIVNAFQLECVNNLLAELEFIQPRTKTLICLGATAYAIAAAKVRIKTGYILERINHPSYYARMGKPNDFTKDLAKIIQGAK